MEDAAKPVSEKGWFKIPGIRPEGDRTIEEQMLGLAPALAEAKGKTVLDLGCAEGAIAREFAQAGAARVLGIELLAPHLAVARAWCRKYPQVRFICAHLGDYIAAQESIRQYDIVLALGIIHKLRDPAVPLRFAAQSARSLMLFRAPAKATHGNVASKHTGITCNVPRIMAAEGFAEERLIPGVRGEAVQYWRRR